MITPEYQEWKEMLMDEITRFPAARLFKDGRIEDTYQRIDEMRLSNYIEIPENLICIESEAFSGVTVPIILPWELEFIAEDAFSNECIILINGSCSDYTWQWMRNHPTLLFHFFGNG